MNEGINKLLCFGEFLAIRAEQALHEKVQAYTPTSQYETDVLGNMMISAGNDLGSTAPYGRKWIFFMRISLTSETCRIERIWTSTQL